MSSVDGEIVRNLLVSTCLLIEKERTQCCADGRPTSRLR
jgi:hypothetical protein